jgi:hypothetical protein
MENALESAFSVKQKCIFNMELFKVDTGMPKLV